MSKAILNFNKDKSAETYCPPFSFYTTVSSMYAEQPEIEIIIAFISIEYNI